MTIGALLLGGLGLCLLVVLAVVRKIVVDEVSGWITPLSERLIRAAVNRLPPQRRRRYEAEWLAELATLRDRRLTGALLAVSLFRGARAMGSALEEVSAPPPDETVSQRTLKPDLEQIAELVHQIVERSRHAGRTWSHVFDELRVSFRHLEVDDAELDDLNDELMDRVSSASESEPYRKWLDDPSVALRRRLRFERAREADREAARKAARAAALRAERRWSGLSGPNWWRRR
jgi:hypothetical protein